MKNTFLVFTCLLIVSCKEEMKKNITAEIIDEPIQINFAFQDDSILMNTKFEMQSFNSDLKINGTSIQNDTNSRVVKDNFIIRIRGWIKQNKIIPNDSLEFYLAVDDSLLELSSEANDLEKTKIKFFRDINKAAIGLGIHNVQLVIKDLEESTYSVLPLNAVVLELIE